MSISKKISYNVRNLFPGYFALVMSTGIIANSAEIAGLSFISRVLFYINIVSFVILIILFLYRLFGFFDEMKRDFLTYEKSPGFFTIVAGSAVLGVQIIMSANGYNTAEAFWLFAVIMWFILFIAFFIFVITSQAKPGIDNGLNGIWLLLVVSTQSIAILGNELSHDIPQRMNAILTFDLLLFLLGSALYLILATLIFYRLVFFPVKTEETDHTYWIDTGAAAISVISGLTLIQNFPASDNFMNLLPFIKGLVLMLWITSTWWIPVIIILEIWRYFIKKVDFKYHPVQWSMIFALGTYSFATIKIGQFIAMPGISVAGKVFLYMAIILWVITFSGMIISILRSVKQ